MFESESGTAPGVQLSTIMDRMEIRKAVQAGQVEEAIDKVNDLNPEVRWWRVVVLWWCGADKHIRDGGKRESHS